MKPKDYDYRLETFNVSSIKRSSIYSNIKSKDHSIKILDNENSLNKKHKTRAKSLRNSPMPLKTIIKFKSPSKSPEPPPESPPNPFSIRFVKLEEIRKKIVNKIYNIKSEVPKLDYQGIIKANYSRKLSPTKHFDSFMTSKSDLNFSSKNPPPESSSNKVLEKLNFKSPFSVQVYSKKSPIIPQNPKLL